MSVGPGWTGARLLATGGVAPVRGEHRRSSLPISGPRAAYLLSGLVRCARCGARYEGVSERTGTATQGVERAKRYGYACGGAVRHGPSVCAKGTVAREALEQTVVDALLAHARAIAQSSDPAALVRCLGLDAENRALASDAQRRTMTARLVEIDSITRNLLDGMSPATRPAIERRLGELDTEGIELRSRIARIEAEARRRRDLDAAVEQLRRAAAALPAALGADDPLERRAALRAWIERIAYDSASRAATITLRTADAAGVCLGDMAHLARDQAAGGAPRSTVPEPALNTITVSVG